MKQELQEQLFKKYPKLFGQKDLPMNQTCMCWGIDCGDGWHWLIDNLCNTIQKYCNAQNEMIQMKKKAGIVPWNDKVFHPEGEPELQVEVTQVKEKFGSLRFYINGGDDTIYGMIELAERLSWNICENCGTTKNIVTTQGWINRVCRRCFKKREKEREKR